MRNQYDIVSNPTFQDLTDWTASSQVSYDTLTNSVYIPGGDGTNTQSIGQYESAWYKFDGTINSQFLVTFDYKKLGTTSDGSIVFTYKCDGPTPYTSTLDTTCDGTQSTSSKPLSQSVSFSHQSYLIDFNGPITALKWTINGSVTAGEDIWISDFHITPTGYTSTDPTWYRYQDLNPTEFNTNDTYIYSKMSDMGWYETNAIND